MSAWIELFLLGIVFSFGPCALSCDPMLLPFVATACRGWKEGLAAVAVFSATRLAVIVLLAGAVAAAGRIATQLLSNHSHVFFYGAGVVACVLGIITMAGRSPGRSLCARLQSAFARDRLKAPALLGVALGFLPCAPFVGVLALIAGRADGLAGGMLLGLAFALGKTVSPIVPLAVLVGVVPQRFLKGERAQLLFERLGGAALALLGVNLIALTAFRG
ncbi:MAG: sulfite exporter TauE/SafE family protein [Planctomycetota bacterium]